MGEKHTTTEGSLNSEVSSMHRSSYEQRREELRMLNPQGFTSTRSGVDVEKAEEVFSELNRQFSNISQQARRLSRQPSRASKPTAMAADVEKTASSAESDDSWDLESALRGDRAAEEEAGIKDKHIGKLHGAEAQALMLMFHPRRHLEESHCTWNGRSQDVHQNLPRCHHRLL